MRGVGREFFCAQKADKMGETVRLMHKMQKYTGEISSTVSLKNTKNSCFHETVFRTTTVYLQNCTKTKTKFLLTIGQSTEKQPEAFPFQAEQRIMRISHKGVQCSRGGAKNLCAFFSSCRFSLLKQQSKRERGKDYEIRSSYFSPQLPGCCRRIGCCTGSDCLRRLLQHRRFRLHCIFRCSCRFR